MKKAFSNIRTFAALLMAGAAFAACSSSNDEIIEKQPANPMPTAQKVYKLTINASKGGNAATRAVSFNGNALKASWAVGDELSVSKEGTSLTSTLKCTNAEDGTFEGTITGTSISPNDYLKLTYHPVASISDFGGQDGTLNGNTNSAENYDMATAEVTVASVDGENITINESEVPFTTQTAMLKLTLTDGTSPINATSLKLSVAMADKDDEIFTSIPTAATYETNGDGILYFAMPNENSLATHFNKTQSWLYQATLTFTASDGFKIYTCKKTGYQLAAAKYYAVTLTMSPTGELSGEFSVSESKKVHFSQGNLQAICASADNDGNTQEEWTWCFATNQWDYIGGSSGGGSEPETGNNYFNGNGSVSAPGTVDLFCWSTDAATNYYGINSSNDLSTYRGNFVEWGDLAITNGGNTASSGWYTLTTDEWNYIFYGRTDANQKYGHGRVNDVYGMILLPDSWTLPSGLSFTAGEKYWRDTYNYTAGEWTQMEAAGAVFLPAAGHRDNLWDTYENVTQSGVFGAYWSKSKRDDDKAYRVVFGDHSLYLNWAVIKEGYSVRLVRTVE